MFYEDLAMLVRAPTPIPHLGGDKWCNGSKRRGCGTPKRRHSQLLQACPRTDRQHERCQ